MFQSRKSAWTRRALATTLLTAAGALLAGPSAAQVQAPAYPARQIKLVVPFPPGGPSDVLARIMAEFLARGLGRPVIVENRPGGNTVIGAQAVASAPPDGGTLLLALDSTLTMNQSLYSKLPYDPLKDFTPIGRVADIPVVLAANPSFPANTVQELIAAARQRPGQITYGASAIPMQLAGESFNRLAGISLQAIPYKGAAQSVQALLGGEISVSFEGAATVLPHWRAGKLKVLGTTGAHPLTQAPAIPTVAASGVPGFEFSVWVALVGPAGLPKDIVSRLNEELVRGMQAPDVQLRLSELGVQPNVGSPDALTAQIRTDAVKWGKLIQELGLKVD